MLEILLNHLLAFISFFATAVAILAGFLTIYILITPYNELRLIREGNTAAAVSLGGAIIGIALPVAVAIAVSHELFSMVGWGLLACVIQLSVFLAVRIMLPQVCRDIPQGKQAAAIFLASLSVGVGIINAACIV